MAINLTPTTNLANNDQSTPKIFYLNGPLNSEEGQKNLKEILNGVNPSQGSNPDPQPPAPQPSSAPLILNLTPEGNKVITIPSLNPNNLPVTGLNQVFPTQNDVSNFAANQPILRGLGAQGTSGWNPALQLVKTQVPKSHVTNLVNYPQVPNESEEKLFSSEGCGNCKKIININSCSRCHPMNKKAGNCGGCEKKKEDGKGCGGCGKEVEKVEGKMDIDDNFSKMKPSKKITSNQIDLLPDYIFEKLRDRILTMRKWGIILTIIGAITVGFGMACISLFHLGKDEDGMDFCFNAHPKTNKLVGKLGSSFPAFNYVTSAAGLLGISTLAIGVVCMFLTRIFDGLSNSAMWLSFINLALMPLMAVLAFLSFAMTIPGDGGKPPCVPLSILSFLIGLMAAPPIAILLFIWYGNKEVLDEIYSLPNLNIEEVKKYYSTPGEITSTTERYLMTSTESKGQPTSTVNNYVETGRTGRGGCYFCGINLDFCGWCTEDEYVDEVIVENISDEDINKTITEETTTTKTVVPTPAPVPEYPRPIANVIPPCMISGGCNTGCGIPAIRYPFSNSRFLWGQIKMASSGNGGCPGVCPQQNQGPQAYVAKD